jgi:hypothetical protein
MLTRRLLLLSRIGAVATAVPLLFFWLGACGGGGPAESEFPGADATVPCVDDDPGEAATYANPGVAIGRDTRKPVGGELASTRYGGELPWFAKTALFVRGNREVVVRVPDDVSDEVKIVGWSETNEPREAVLAQPTTACPEDWTAYPGGLAFRGRHCLRLRVEGPGNARGSALVGLRKDCSA